MENRIIKFRVYNGHEMEYNVTNGKFGAFYVNPENGDGLNPKDTASLSPNTSKYHENTLIMQFTGLLDKNGKEIYEGDVLSNKWKAAVYKDENTGAFMVRFHVNEELNKPRTLYDYLNGRKKAGCEAEDNIIIGNIHKHPNLLVP